MTRQTLYLITGWLIGLLLPRLVRAQVTVYPAPAGVSASSQYAVTVSQNGQTQPSFVYSTEAQYPKFNRHKTTSFTTFSFAGRVTVTITKRQGTFKTCRIRPSSYAIKPVIQGNTVRFTIDRPRHVSVEFDDDLTHPMLLFADAPETNVPNPTDPAVLYFGPGVHDLPEPIKPKPGQTIYLAGGAVVNALIVGENVPNVTIRGRGILSGRKFGHTHGKHIWLSGNGSTNALIEGITLVDSPGYYVTTGGDRTTIRNLKGIGWWFNTDGFSTGTNALIDDCFLKCNDDAIKLYRSGLRVYRTTIWQMENGAPFQISWNMNSDNAGFVVQDCDVIHCEHRWDNPNEGVFVAIHGGGGVMADYQFDNIRVENADWRLVNIQILPNRFAKSDRLGSIRNLRFSNIRVTTSHGQPPARLNVIQGFDPNSLVSDVQFTNLIINGQPVRSAAEGGFAINPRTTANVRFATTQKTTANPQPVARAPVSLTWTNPITNGLNSYGQKDVFVMAEQGRHYLVATEQTNPEWPKRGIMLYQSDDLAHWRESALLLNRLALPDSAWCRDEWTAPELHRIDGKYYLTFMGRNNRLRPYKKLGFGMAVADRIEGPYRIVTPDKPLFYGNNATLLQAPAGTVHVYYDLDGRFYTAELNVASARLNTQPVEMLGPATLGRDFHFLDAPSVMQHNGRYYLLFSQFRAGYVVKVQYLVADTPTGPWRSLTNEPLFSFLEAEADEVLKMPYPSPNAFAPPTQVIFQHSLFKGPTGQYFMAYHSSDKYSEPYLCIEPVAFDEQGKLVLPAPKQKLQSIALKP